MKVVLHSGASADLQESGDWYEVRRSGLAVEFAHEVQRAIDVIAESPRTWPRWPGSTHKPHIRRFLISRFPFALAYVIKRDHVVVLAIAHTSRDPFYWLDRLRT